VTREASAEHVAEAVWRAANDELACSPRVAASLLRHVRELAALRPPDAAGPGLTPREREIVGLIDEGLSNKQIASRLCIELPTVKNHVHNILEKLHVSRRGEAVARLRQSRRAAGV
jgi:two-component system, NarL family, nitrate/nitrite response regulator NarL